MGIKATSATVGATLGTAAHPIKTTAHGINAGKKGIEKGISGIKKGAVYAAQKTKEFGNSAIKQPFVSGSNFATGSNKTNANSTSDLLLTSIAKFFFQSVIISTSNPFLSL